MRKVLVSEDEDAIRDFVVINLRRAGYEVTDCDNGDEALEVFNRAGGEFDVAILDIMMPGTDGVKLCKILRERSATIGILMLSAKSQEMDKINCLMSGADDYMTKPFSPSELVARVDALYRRVTMAAQRSSEEIQSGPFVMNMKTHTVMKNGNVLDLTQVEYHIIEYFLSNSETALDRRSLLRKVWGDAYFGDDKIVDVNIRRLRTKIEDDPSKPQYIQTIWGFGYKWTTKETR